MRCSMKVCLYHRVFERVNGFIAKLQIVVGPLSTLAMGKGEEHIKLFLSSQTQKFIRFYSI